MNPSRERESRLLKLVREALVVWPQNAQIQLLEYLRSAGASSSDLSLFQRSWSKCPLSSTYASTNVVITLCSLLIFQKGSVYVEQHAFGNENADVNVESFACNFSNQVMKACVEADAIRDIIRSIDDKFHNVKSAEFSSCNGVSQDIIFHVMDSCRQLTNSRNELFDSSASSIQSISHKSIKCAADEVGSSGSTVTLRKCSREGKIIWHRRRIAKDKFDTISSIPFGVICDTLYGTLKYRPDIEGLSSIVVKGLCIPNGQRNLLRRCWESYLMMSLMSACPNSLFPTPLKIVHDNLRHTIFVFENIKTNSLIRLSEKNPVGLSLGLLRYPSVILAWCGQFGAAIESLHGSILKSTGTMKVNEVF